MRCIRLDDLGHLKAGDMIPWNRHPLWLTTTPRREGARWDALGTWDWRAVRVRQEVGAELEVWCVRERGGGPAAGGEGRRWAPGATDATRAPGAPTTP
jgi:hypothetical protein